MGYFIIVNYLKITYLLIFGLREKNLLGNISLDIFCQGFTELLELFFSEFLPSVIFGQNVSVGLLTFGESDLRLLAALLEKYT